MEYTLSKVLPTKSSKNKTKQNKSNPPQWGINLEVLFVFISGDFFLSKDEIFQGNQKKNKNHPIKLASKL